MFSPPFFGTLLETYFYQIQDCHIPLCQLPMYSIQFSGRTVRELKMAIFQKHRGDLPSERDFECVYNKQVLEDDFDVEYCLNTSQLPIKVFIPKDIDYKLLKIWAKMCCERSIQLRKREIWQDHQSLKNKPLPEPRILDLQIQIETIEKALSHIATQPYQRRYELDQPAKKAKSLKKRRKSVQMIDIDGTIDLSSELTEGSIQIDDDVGTEFEEVNFQSKKPVWVAACPPNQDLCLEPEVLLAQSLKRVDIQPLVIEINRLIHMFGGVAKAFDMEWKIRLFVIAVLNFALIEKSKYDSYLEKLSGFHFRDLDNLVLDGEKFIEQFDQRVQPDLTVSADQGMLYIVEIKNLRCSTGRGIILQAVSENFKQLRNFCFSKQKTTCSGISTNFGVWIFTRYSKKEEMVGNMPFCVTESFEVMDIKSDEISEQELARLVICLRWLCKIKDKVDPSQFVQTLPPLIRKTDPIEIRIN